MKTKGSEHSMSTFCYQQLEWNWLKRAPPIGGPLLSD